MRTQTLAPVLLFLAWPALAQEPAGPPSQETVWQVTFRGKEIGTERAREHVKDGTRFVASKGDMQLPGAPRFEYDQRTEVSAKDGALRSYRLSSSMIKASATPTEKGARLEVSYMGKGGEKTVVAEAPVIVLDNLVWSHFELLGRLAARHQDEAFNLTVLVPQRQACVAGRFKPGAPFAWKVGDAELTLRRGELSLAGQLIALTYDAETGRAYRVELPASQFDCFLRGFERPKEESAEEGEEVRWRETEVPLPLPLGELPGVLCLPLAEVKGPYPGVVLVHGSGPNDRDETIGPNKPFRDLAHGLAKRGIATLRYDKRTLLLKKGFLQGGEAAKKAAKFLQTLTLREETIDDAIAALGWLKAREEISRTYVLGHSLGAMAAPEIASEAADLAGVIMLAGPARGIDVLTCEQLLYKATLAGKTEEEAKAVVEENGGKLFRQARAGELPDSARIMGASVSYWRDLFRRDDVPAALAKVEQPVLLLQGSKDYQVTLVDYGLLEAALKKREGVPHKARVFEGLNHLFMKVEGKSTGAEYMIRGKVEEQVIDEIAAWIKG